MTEPGGPSTGPIRSMVLKGTTLVLGYPESQEGVPKVSVLTRSTPSSSDWYATQATLLSGESAADSGDFGRAVDYVMSPLQRIVVGAPSANSPENESGAVYVFRKTGSTWALEQKIVSPLPGAFTHFGSAVSLSSSTLLVGQPDTVGGAGRVFVFDLLPSAPFSQYSNALVGDGLSSSTAAFGSAVVVQGSRALLGAPGEASNVGAVRSVDDVHCTMTGYCFGDGSGLHCPCANHSSLGSGQGCLNSFGTGALLAGTGVARVTADTVQLQLTGTPPTGQAPTFFQGTLATAGGPGSVFADGLRCASGSVIRLGTRPSVAGAVSFGSGISGDPLVSVQGAIPAVGTTRFYQANYRNAAAFCTSATQNSSNGLRITWSP